MRSWRLRPGLDIRTVVWGDEGVLYNCNSRHTHVVNRPVLAVIEHLRAGWAPIDDISSAYNLALAADAGAVDNEILISLLNELGQLGMVETNAA